VKRATLFESALFAATALGLCLASSACGVTPQQYASKDSYNRGYSADMSGLTDPSEQGSFSCPVSANVTPHYDWNLDGTDFFTVCTSKDSAYDLIIHGKTHDSSTVCVYPLQYYSSSQIVWKADAQGFPMVKCQEISGAGNGIAVTFDKTNFNALIIVEGPDSDQMRLCLTNNNVPCPHYSYGKFRD
jgi:hypothetical protein